MNKYRMYHLVMYNISPIQQGIQSYHAGMEYAKNHFNDEDFKKWLLHDKTVIILNGGTSNESKQTSGTMQKYYDELINNGIKIAGFWEPDLNDTLSAIAFLVPEQVWDKEKYPDWDEKLARSLSIPQDIYSKLHKKYYDKIGGEKNIFLRQFLSKFKTA